MDPPSHPPSATLLHSRVWAWRGRTAAQNDGFTVDHFAGMITYDPADFLKKNVDELHADLQTLLSTQVGRLEVG